MRPIVIESPFGGCVPLNRAYLQACIRDCLRLGETPYASHQMLTWALDDKNPEERALGIEAGIDFRDKCMLSSVFYVDLGWSTGMNDARATLPPECVYERKIKDAAWPRVITEARTSPDFDRCYVHVRNEADPHMPLYGLAQMARDLFLKAAAIKV